MKMSIICNYRKIKKGIKCYKQGANMQEINILQSKHQAHNQKVVIYTKYHLI